jgi:hypothetical protein
MYDLFRKSLILSLVLSFGGLLACGGAEQENQNQQNQNQQNQNQVNQNQDDGFTVTNMELLTRGDSPMVLADTHGEHWHGSLTLYVGASHTSVGVRWLDENDEAIDVDYNHYLFAAALDTGAPALVTFDFHGDHLHIIPGEDEGTTAVVFSLEHDGEAVYTSPPIVVNVIDEAHNAHNQNDQNHHHGPEVHELALFDRDSGEELADTHGHDWHGAPLVIALGGELEVDVEFYDEDAELIALDGHHYSVGYRYAPEADEDVVAITAHGDHFDIEGLLVGTTAIIIQLLHEGEMEWEAPPLTLEVVVVE